MYVIVIACYSLYHNLEQSMCCFHQQVEVELINDSDSENVLKRYSKTETGLDRHGTSGRPGWQLCQLLILRPRKSCSRQFPVAQLTSSSCFLLIQITWEQLDITNSTTKLKDNKLTI